MSMPLQLPAQSPVAMPLQARLPWGVPLVAVQVPSWPATSQAAPVSGHGGLEQEPATQLLPMHTSPGVQLSPAWRTMPPPPPSVPARSGRVPPANVSGTAVQPLASVTLTLVVATTLAPWTAVTVMSSDSPAG